MNGPQPTRFSGILTAVLERQAASGTGRLEERLSTLLLSPEFSLPGAFERADPFTVRVTLERAEVDIGTPWAVPLASAAARVHRDGDREQWETRAFARQRRLSRATIAAAATREDRFVDEVADGVQLLCEQSSWCWPAHDDALRERGSILATVTAPFLDLGAGEVVGQLAWIDQVLGDLLDERYPGLRSRMRHEARTRVLRPFVERRDWHWLGLDGDVHNWNPWIHGNVLVAALRFLDAPTESEDRARVVALVIEGLDRYVSALPADGAIDEGYAYWWNGACRALEALHLLSFATAGVLDPISEIESLRETIAFPHRMHLGGDWYLNLADGQARPPRDQPWHALHRAARHIGDSATAALAASHRILGEPVASEAQGLGRLLLGITDDEWIATGSQPSPLPRDVWLPSIDVLLARETEGRASGLTLAVKGGHNGENHNHNDVGSLIVASDGVPVIVDAGRPTYTLATFGPDRYSIWSMQSSWHSVPEVRGVAQHVGATAAASDVVVGVGEQISSISLELASAYAVPDLRSWRRHVSLDRELSRVLILDSWQLEEWHEASNEPPTTVRFLLAGSVTLGRGVAIIEPLDDKPSVRVGWPEHIPAILTVQKLDDPMLSDVWGGALTRLELFVTGQSSISVTVDIPGKSDKKHTRGRDER